MNPLISRQIHALERGLLDLEEAVEASHAFFDTQTQAHDKLFQENWRLRKQLSALQRSNEDYDVLQAANQEYASRLAQLRDLSRDLLNILKSLSTTVRVS